MTHAERVRDAEQAVVEKARELRATLRPEHDDGEGAAFEWSTRSEIAAEAMCDAVDKADALRAATCPTCGGTGKSAMQVAPGARGVVFGPCPAGCDEGRRR